MKSPLFSIVVPVYNAEKFLSQCIDSILSQTLTDFQLLLIDDGSTDNSSAICDEYACKDSRISVFHKKNGGVSSARNQGIEQATGEWVAFVDSDDWLANDFLEQMFREAEKSNANAVFCNCYYVYGNEYKEYIRFTNNKIENSEAVLKRILNKYEMRSELWGKIIRRKFLQSLKLNEHIAIGEDLLYLLEIYYRNECKTVILRAPLYYYRQIEISAMNRHNIANHNKKLLMEYLQFVKLHPDLPEKFPRENAVFIIRVLLSSLKRDINQYKDAFVMNHLKENFNTAKVNLQRNEKRLIYLLYIHPLLAKMEQRIIKLFFERK